VKLARLFLVAACLLGVGFASTAQAPTLAPLSSADREQLVADLRFCGVMTRLWSEYYSITPGEYAYWAGRADGLEMAAAILETHRPRTVGAAQP
jgi:hypothetical protein